MAKLIPTTASATSSYSGNTASLAIDGSTTTRWESNSTFATTSNEVFVLNFPAPVTPKQLRVIFRTWGQELRVGYSNTASTTKASFTEIKNVSFASQPNDSLGNPWQVITANTGGMDIGSANVLNMADNTISARYWAIWTNDTTNVDRLRIWEISMHDTDSLTGTGLVIPSPAPAAPFTAIPNSSWTRTEYATPGEFTFTPAADTRLILAVAQGAGAGGRVYIDTAAKDTPDLASLNGGPTIISGPAGTILGAGGGRKALGGLLVAKPSDIPQTWYGFTDHGANDALTTSAGTTTGAAGRISTLGLTQAPRPTLTLAPTNAPVTVATSNFDGTAAVQISPTLDQFARNTTYGYQSTNTAPESVSTFEFTIWACAGQTVAFVVYKYATYSSDFLVYHNGEQYNGVMGGGSGSYSIAARTITTTGLQTFKFTYKRSASGGTTAQGWASVSRMSITGVGYGATDGGASGRALSAYLPPQTLSITVGKGGTGQAGGHTGVTSAQNGLRGAGAAAGGNGGDGVVVIYEYKGLLDYSSQTPILLSNYNVAPGTQVAGATRSDYIAERLDLSAPGFLSASHKLQPSTKSVVAIMVGAGGTFGGTSTNPRTFSPTKLKIGDLEFVAESGQGPGPTGTGAGGKFSSTAEVAQYGDGPAGYSSSQGSAAPDRSTVAGSYGRGSANTPGSYGGGGYGAWAFLVITKIPEDRTISLEVAHASTVSGNSNYYYNAPGAVFLYELDTDVGPYITQVTEQVLIREPNAATQITQLTEQVLLKDKNAATQITQSTQQILLKDDDSGNALQTSYAAIAYIMDAVDPATAITQNTQQVLLKDKQAPTQTTQNIQQVLLKAFPTQFRVTAVPQLVLVSEVPSVFFMNFGTLENPVKNRLYDSRQARATSVPAGATIQIEGPRAPGTVMFVNGVEVGETSAIANNDQVYIHGGVSNYYQQAIYVYAYYLTNGEVTRELVGIWNVKQPELSPTKSRAYAVYFQNNSFIFLKAKYAGAQYVGYLVAKALATYAQMTGVLFAGARSAYNSFTGFFTTTAPAYVAQMTDFLVTSAQQAKFLVTETMVTKAYTKLSDLFDWEIAQVDYSTAENDPMASPHVGYGLYEATNDFLKASNGTEFVIPEYLETHAGYAVYENREFEPTQAQHAYYQNDQFQETHVNYGSYNVLYEYNDVGKSYEAGVEWTAVLSTGFARPFEMEFTDTEAYSVLTGTDYVKGENVSIDGWQMPTDDAIWTRAGYGLVDRETSVLTKAKISFYQMETIKQLSPIYDTFAKTSLWSQKHSSTFQQSVVKNVNHSEPVQMTPIRTINNHKLVPLTPYIAQELVVKGKAPAQTYMGFNTRQDALDYTENFYGVTVFSAYNGYVYNLAIDMSFICEISYVGPVSGLMQGG